MVDKIINADSPTVGNQQITRTDGVGSSFGRGAEEDHRDQWRRRTDRQVGSACRPLTSRE
ncbi:hypothetical protein [Streptomyces sp. BE133]|uniref:hypothetical protein n=1 Tax=Streptomyces sp. BE133 TaxID=3002523 RepID=UPI002E7A6B70|nr:hypothetical protein [Streptomyces sp. BE133]MEE1809729.1 hypothetical protein [Streptomyces sp. BE133]